MPDDWNPSLPLPNAEHEAEAVERANAGARVEYLKQQALERVKPPEKKRKKGPFGD